MFGTKLAQNHFVALQFQQTPAAYGGAPVGRMRE